MTLNDAVQEKVRELAALIAVGRNPQELRQMTVKQLADELAAINRDATRFIDGYATRIGRD